MASNVGQQGQRMGATFPASNPGGATSNAQAGPSPAAVRVRLSNWSHTEIIALITCKHKEYAALKHLVDPRARMVTAAEKWKTISAELEALAHSRTPRGAKICKDKWNSLNTDYRKVSDYGKGTGNHTSYWNLSNEEKDRHGLPCQFDPDYFEAIEAFQGERNINTPTHLRDSQGAADSVFSDANIRTSEPPSAQGEPQSIPALCVNLDSDSQPFPSQNIIELTDTPEPTPVPLGSAPTSAPGNTLVKRKRSSAFMPVINAADKSSKFMVQAMQELEKSRTRSQIKNSRQHLDYLKTKDHKAHKMTNSMIHVLSNLSTAMCHAFIKDPAFIPPAVNLSQSSDDAPRPSLHVLDSDEDI